MRSRRGCDVVTVLCGVRIGPPTMAARWRCSRQLALMPNHAKFGASMICATSSQMIGRHTSTCLLGPQAPTFATASRRGYAIMDRYRRMNANKKDQDAASTGQEASTATAATAAKEGEEAKARARAKRMRGVIPLRHLRSDPPPEVMGIAMDSSLPSALESESSAGRVLEVTLLGAPNAGKSSLANALLQSRVRPSRAACRVSWVVSCRVRCKRWLVAWCGGSLTAAVPATGVGSESEGADDAGAGDRHSPGPSKQHTSGPLFSLFPHLPRACLGLVGSLIGGAGAGAACRSCQTRRAWCRRVCRRGEC
jgi:hypothetical protein